MPQYLISKEIKNTYLGVSKVIKANTEIELMNKIREQQEKWAVQEKRKKDIEYMNTLKKKAEQDTKREEERINGYKMILVDGIKVNNQIKWNALYKREPFKQFYYHKQYPTYEEIAEEIGVPEENKFAEFFFNYFKENRLKKEEEARSLLSNKIETIDKQEEEARNKYLLEKKQYELKQRERNDSIDKFKQAFESGDPEAISKFVSIILRQSTYPEGFRKSYEVSFDGNSNCIVVNYMLPNPDNVPQIKEYKYVATKKTVNPVKINKKDFNKYYESIICQIALKTIHEIFKAVYVEHVQAVVFNGWVEGIDGKTGNNYRSCILSCFVQRDNFETFNLARVNPKECIKGLKGIYAGSMVELAPVEPIMRINKDDNRFVESKEVLSKLDSSQNLATMDWSDFEHLVSELFGKIFSKEGSEVNVTQASRDGGVDAVAYDPDPIKGGKFVIQAKRYNNVVPVSAVRDLYGTMMNEGAAKGILVTTSYYGPDSREFAKGKSITLIDGSQLIYLFQEHGHNVCIELSNKKKASLR